MTYYGNTDTICVKAKGSIPTNFISTTFEVNVTAIDRTGPKAKEKAKDRIAAIWNVIHGFVGKAGIDTERLRTTFSIDIHKERDRTTGDMKFLGYKAVYSITFNVRNVLESLNVHDALTSIEGVESPHTNL